MDRTPTLRYVDPYRAGVAKSRLWRSAKVAWKLDPHLLKLTRGLATVLMRS